MNKECCNEEPEKKPEKEAFLFAAKTPYPPICIEQKNPAYGRMMLDNIGGGNSEMSAISLYIYNQMITAGSRDEISQIFHKISVVEMHHLYIFGELAFELGENPRLWTHKRNQMFYWTPGYNNYPTQYVPLLKNALAGEEDAIRKYQQQINHIKDPYIQANLERIIEDERLHVQIYKKLLAEAERC